MIRDSTCLTMCICLDLSELVRIPIRAPTGMISQDQSGGRTRMTEHNLLIYANGMSDFGEVTQVAAEMPNCNLGLFVRMKLYKRSHCGISPNNMKFKC